MENNWVGLLDCNNFFVSCERLFRPDLVGKPVAVLSSNDGCVLARSQEVKDMNVPMGVPYFQIKDSLEKGSVTTFSSHIALYRDISRRVFEVMKRELGQIEQYSIDEAFFTFSGSKSDLMQRVEDLKRAVEKETGIPVSIGVAHSKTQAKFAGSLAKKGSGIKVVDREEWASLVGQIPLAKIWGVGGRMELRYKQYNLLTVADILEADEQRLGVTLGVVAVRLQRELQGFNSSIGGNNHHASQKSIMSSRSFKDTTENIEVLADALAYHVRQVAADLRSMGLKTASLRVAINTSRHGDFLLRGGSKEVILNQATSDTLVLMRAAQDSLKQLFETGVPYKKVGVTISGFSESGVVQGDLFSESEVDEKGKNLMTIIDTLNSGKNRELVKLGARLRTKDWQGRQDARSPAYTTRWSDLASVSAK